VEFGGDEGGRHSSGDNDDGGNKSYDEEEVRSPLALDSFMQTKRFFIGILG
jgi:hypothetical protein